MKKEILLYIMYAAILSIAVYIFAQKINRKKYEDFLNNLGFGDFWTSQMRVDELQAMYIYITQYTQKGVHVPVDSDLDRRLTKIAGKYPAILQLKDQF